MAQTAEKVLEFPAGGIADFYMEDDDIAALEREEAKKAFGDNGIANFSDVANRMASYGRGGDDTLAHVATGEIVIPLPLIDNNPEMKASIFKHLEELGVEDPEQYVVGSSANSINPETGLREFGWLKKTFRKVSRAVKKATKSVVKLVKKAAPIILPFVLGPAGLGLNMMYAGALGAGIGTLVQGGNIKDALKNALIGGAIGGVTQGVQSGMAAGKGNFIKGFTSGVKNVATNPMQSSFTQAMSGVSSSIPGAGENLSNAELSQATNTGDLSPAEVRTQATDFQGQYADAGTTVTDAGAARMTSAPDNFVRDQSITDALMGGAESAASAPVPDYAKQAMANVDASYLKDPIGGGGNLLDTAKGYYDTATDYLFQGGKSDAAVNLAKEKAGQAYLKDMAAAGIPASEAGLAAAKAAAGPGMLATYGPSLALAGTAAYAGGAFDTPEEPPEEELQTGADLIALNPGDYLLPEETPQYAQGPTMVGTNYGIDPRTGRPIVNPFRRPSYGLPVLAAEGGEIFPRRVGGIMPDEGVPGKDSVRAMLMPGEFVMTTDAVRGLGNGNNDQGIRNMYDMMRGLEAKGRAMA
jgi:hypothetical protein